MCNSSLLGKYQKSNYEKNQCLEIAPDMGKHKLKNFLGYRSIVDVIVCNYILQYFATGIMQKGIIFNFGPCNTLFFTLLTSFSWKMHFSAHICLCLCFKLIIIVQHIHLSKIIFYSSNLLRKIRKKCHEKNSASSDCPQHG